jgi:hypothetical protein
MSSPPPLLLPPLSPVPTPPSPTPPCHLLKLPEELQQKIWRLSLPDFTIHHVVIEILSGYNRWCKADPGDWPGLNALDPMYDKRPCHRWRQVIKSPRRPAGLDVCKDSRRIMLPWFREFPRRCIRQLVQNNEGEDYFLDIDDPSRGSLSLGLCNPLTDFLYVKGELAMFPLNLRDVPVLGVSVQLAKNGSVGYGLACNLLARVVSPHYSPRLSYINVVFTWRYNELVGEHRLCDITVPVGRPVVWTGNAGHVEALPIYNWQFVHYGQDDNRIATGGQFHEEDLMALPQHDTGSHTMLVLSTMPMSCKCSGMVEAMTTLAASLTDEEMAQFHPK